MTDRQKLDTLFSEFIRKRATQRVGGCERCLTLKWDKTKDGGSVFPAWKQLQTSHFHGRRKRSVRWDEDNAAGLCGACHLYLTANPLEHCEWFRNRLGEESFNNLNIRANLITKLDLNLLTLYYKGKLKDDYGE